MSEYSGQALLARIVELEKDMEAVKEDLYKRDMASIGTKVPVIDIEPKQTVNAALPTWSESHKEETAKPGDRKPKLNADGTENQNFELSYDGRGWELVRKDIQANEGNHE